MRFRAYYKDGLGQLTVGHVDCIGEDIYSQTGRILRPDEEETIRLIGWPDYYARSYDRGRVFVSAHAVKGMSI